MSDPLATSGKPSGPQLTRRRLLLESAAALGAAPWLLLAGPARAATAASAETATGPLRLPLQLRQLVNHIGISVPDVAKSATFYSHLFDPGMLLGQRQPALRYLIDFRPGSLSIGPLKAAAQGAQTKAFIDHFAVMARSFELAAWRARLTQQGLHYFAAGTFVDIDSIPVQLLGGLRPLSAHPQGIRHAAPAAEHHGVAPGGFAPMPALYSGQPLVTAHGFRQVTLRVSHLDAASATFQQLFGLTPHRSASKRLYFALNGTRLGLEQAASGESPAIAAFAIKVLKFDFGRVRAGLEARGARVEPVAAREKERRLRFVDPDGIRCELWEI
ncbi:MAG: VOC family protein [Steroidobacteraceae bacterium]